MRFNRLTPLALLLAGAPMIAQETTGTLVGTTRTKSGQPIVGVLVEISSPKLLGTRSAVTDAKGDFRIPLLPTGTYTIAFSAKGHYTNKGHFNLLAGQVLRQDGLLQEETVQSVEVAVTATIAQIDKTDTTTQTAMSAETLQTIFPASDLAALVYASPGVVRGATGDDLAPSIRGGIGVGTMVSMNGAPGKSMVKNLYEMRLTIPDMIESVSVVQSPMNAKLGNTDGGSISYVTSRGTNEFTGSIRRTEAGRNFWRSESQYPNKLGEVSNKLQAPDSPDLVNGQWNITLKGPIWKDHITFAYGGWLKPTTIGQKMWSKSVSDVPQLTDTASTFFRDPSNGQIFRQAQLSPYDGKFTPMQNIWNWNQYSLYWQINTNHQLEYGYVKEFKSDNIENGAWFGGDPGLPLGTFEQDRTLWNIGYKGIIGKAGLLDVHLSQRKEAYVHATTKEPGIFTWRGQNNIPDTDTGQMRPANDPIELWYWNTPSLMEYGRSYGDHDTLSTLSDSINYQHILEWRGTHVIDVGMNDLGAKYENQNAKDYNFMTFGRLSTGTPGSNAGQYIVLPNNVTIGDLTGGGAWTYDGNNFPADMLWRDAPSWIGPRSIMTRMSKSTGPGNGISHSNNRAFYLNDQWTINEHHSVMVGLRMDHFKFWDDSKTIHSYNQWTPRFEYKFDLNGDQKRIFNLSYGQFAETPHSVYFLPYAQSYLPYRTMNYWTGAANPSPYTGSPSAPYLVNQAQLINPANYAFIPGLSTFSMVGGPGEQLNPNMRGPVSTETTVGFRRGFENGGYYRASFVKKTWRHLFDYFPGAEGVQQTFPQDYFPGVAPTQVLPRILADDGQAHRTYKALELEWNFIFTKRVSLGGNYTYSRLTANDSSMTLENPSGQGKNGGDDRNWRDYLNTFVSASDRNPESLRSGGHVWNAWLVWDLTIGKLKQSLVIRGNYASGTPFSSGQNYNIPRPTVPGYYNDGTNNNTTGLPTSVTAYYGGPGQFARTDTWSTSLRYNIETPLYKTLVWFCSFDVKNWLNNIHTTGYDLYNGNNSNTGYNGSDGGVINYIGSGTPNWPSGGAVPANLAGGPRLNSRDTRAGAGFTGARSISLETGFRF